MFPTLVVVILAVVVEHSRARLPKRIGYQLKRWHLKCILPLYNFEEVKPIFHTQEGDSRLPQNAETEDSVFTGMVRPPKSSFFVGWIQLTHISPLAECRRWTCELPGPRLNTSQRGTNSTPFLTIILLCREGNVSKLEYFSIASLLFQIASFRIVIICKFQVFFFYHQLVGQLLSLCLSIPPINPWFPKQSAGVMIGTCHGLSLAGLVYKIYECIRETSEKQPFLTSFGLCISVSVSSVDFLPLLIFPQHQHHHHHQFSPMGCGPACALWQKTLRQRCLFSKCSLGGSTLKVLKPLYILSLGGSFNLLNSILL